MNFIQLVVSRIFVGAGEAGCFPASFSIIGDYSPPRKWASAIAFFSLGAPFGTLLGLLVGGFLVEAYGWRFALIVAGTPGLILAVLAWATLTEPRSAQSVEERKAVLAGLPGFWETLRYLSAKRTFWFMTCGVTLKGFSAAGVVAFVAPFFLRNHEAGLAAAAAAVGLPTMALLALVLAISSVILGTLGTLVGGYLGDRLGGDDAKGLVTIAAVATLLAAPFYMWALLTPYSILGVCLLAIPNCLNGVSFGPAGAILVGIAPARMRAMTKALEGMIASMFGYALGPLMVGILSDFLSVKMGLGSANGLRFAMMAAASGYIIAAWLEFQARKSVSHDIVREGPSAQLQE